MIQHYFVTAWVPAKGERQFYARAVDKNLYSIGTLLPLGAVAPGATASGQATLYIGIERRSRARTRARSSATPKGLAR